MIRLHRPSRLSATESLPMMPGCTVASRVVLWIPNPLFIKHKIIADSFIACKVDEPSSRRSGGDEDLADRMCRLGLISGGLQATVTMTSSVAQHVWAVAKTSFVHPPAVRVLVATGLYTSSGEDYESDASIYDRRPRYTDDEPRREKRFSGLVSMFGGWTL